MNLIALCGAAGAGKDTVADMLPVRKIAFSDALYEEVAQAWGVSVEFLKFRDTKETPQNRLALSACQDKDFGARTWATHPGAGLMESRSPRQILQLWSDYRRSDNPDYFVQEVNTQLYYFPAAVIVDVRYANEVELVRFYGGEIWQVKRAGIEAGATGHISDTDGSEFNPDAIIDNDGTLMSLAQKVKAAWMLARSTAA